MRAMSLCVVVALAVGCQKNKQAEGPIERAGKHVDHAAEKTGQALETAAEKTGEASKKAAQATGKAFEKAGKKLQGNGSAAPPSSAAPAKKSP
jgi:hypothetical protein